MTGKSLVQTVQVTHDVVAIKPEITSRQLRQFASPYEIKTRFDANDPSVVQLVKETLQENITGVSGVINLDQITNIRLDDFNLPNNQAYLEVVFNYQGVDALPIELHCNIVNLPYQPFRIDVKKADQLANKAAGYITSVNAHEFLDIKGLYQVNYEIDDAQTNNNYREGIETIVFKPTKIVNHEGKVVDGTLTPYKITNFHPVPEVQLG